MQPIAAIIVVAVFGWICWSFLRAPAEFVVRLARGGVAFQGKFPLSRRSEVAEFLRRELDHCGRVTISGCRSANRRLRIVVRGRVSEGDRQKIRNFFQTIL